MEQTTYKERFFDKVSDLNKDYCNVKHAIILLENLDDKRKMYIAPINQLRSALDHLFKAVVEMSEDKCDYELKEAKEHLDRAGYDALELLAGELGNKVIDKLSRYDTATLSVVFPWYFTKIKPQLVDVKKDVATLRSGRKTSTEESFSSYFEKFQELVEIDKEVDRMIPSLEEYQMRQKAEEEKKQKAEARRGIVGQIIVGLVVTVVAFLLGRWFK